MSRIEFTGIFQGKLNVGIEFVFGSSSGTRSSVCGWQVVDYARVEWFCEPLLPIRKRSFKFYACWQSKLLKHILFLKFVFVLPFQIFRFVLSISRSGSIQNEVFYTLPECELNFWILICENLFSILQESAPDCLQVRNTSDNSIGVWWRPTTLYEKI